jgi:hypothetical protein
MADDGIVRLAKLQARRQATRAGRSPVDGGSLPQRDKLLIVADHCRFWQCDEGIAHATIQVGRHHEHHRVRSQRFREWLLVEAGRAFPMEVAGQQRPGTFGKNAMEDALLACEAVAAVSGARMVAPLRIAQLEWRLYLDLGDAEWRAVEISPDGWRITNTTPTPIVRTRRTRALPVPQPGGSLAPLHDLLPIEDEDDHRLVVLWLLAALRPTGPYPILAISGEQGTGKSFVARVLRRLVDPCGDDVMQPPRDDRDLIAAARGNHVLALDNLSHISNDLADSLCRLATGGDIGGRLLYTNDDSAVFAAKRPIIINGIPDLARRGDLASRAIFLRLSPMQQRRPEAELWAYFNTVAPEVLGALLDALSAALAVLPTIKFPEDAGDLRMADFALLAMAAEKALQWAEGSAVATIRRNAQGAVTAIVDLDAVATAIRVFLDTEKSYSGLVSALYKRVSGLVDDDTRQGQGWPRDPARFGEHLRRIAPALRGTGIALAERHSNRGTVVTISKASTG